MSVYRGRPAGYRRWPGRLIRAARAVGHWAVIAGAPVAAGVIVGVVLLIALLPYLVPVLR